MDDNKYLVKVTSKHKLFDLHIRETFRYKDLILLFVKRDFASKYKQTLLGPLWAVIQPLLTTFVFAFVFGNLAKLTTSDLPDIYSIPGFLFYMSGTMIFHYFSTNVAGVSGIFIKNSAIMGKVYYPRFVQPVATAISNLISFAIQFGIFLCVWIVYMTMGTTDMIITPWLCFLPLIVLEMMVLSTGLGMLISAVTTKYRDLQMLVSFGLQLWQYASPVAYGLSLIITSEKWSNILPAYMICNPISSVITTFRYAMFGHGYFDVLYYLLGWAISIIIFFLGLLLFSKTERTFMDTI